MIKSDFMISDFMKFLSSLIVVVLMLSAVAVIAKNFEGITSPSDLLSYCRETGRLYFLGEAYTISQSNVDTAEKILCAASDYFRGFTPFCMEWSAK